jgi:di/tricarboxylate transporter
MDQAIITVLVILAITVILLVFEIVRIDIVALLCLLALTWTDVITPQEAFAGFSSNAVISMMAVMILGHGLAKTGIMDSYSRIVINKVGASRSKLVGVTSLLSGVLSAFIQNIGAAALFLPGIMNISRRSKIPASALIMPIGFATIIGGAISMVGSGSLIVVNDLLRSAGMETYSLFSVAPVGIALLIFGVTYFYFFGSKVLPSESDQKLLVSDQEKLIQALNLPNQIWPFVIPPKSTLVGLTTEQSGVWDNYNLHILGLSRDRELEYAPWRESSFQAGQEVAILGEKTAVEQFAGAYDLIPRNSDDHFTALNDPTRAGFAEVIIPPRSELVGKTIRQYTLRKRYAVEPVTLFSRGEQIRGDFSDHQINSGDTMIVHGLWENIESMRTGANFVVITSFSHNKKDSSKSWLALLCFLVGIILALAGTSIALAFLTGAVAAVLLKVLSIEEAYKAIEWKVIFLIAGLIPLGTAMQNTGAAAFLAGILMQQIQDGHPLLLLLAIAFLGTLLSLFISNVGAVVVLTPLVINIALIGELDPRPLVLLAAVSALNSFILPTHQVNALLMSSGGYRNADYLKAGSGMTLVFIIVVVFMFYLFYI